jgi:glycosyltransferase involved in cell wall biosynthesis
MRILFLSTWFPYPPDNGSKIRVYHLLQALACSHSVTLAAFRPVNGKMSEQIVSSDCRISICPVAVDPFRYVNIPQMLKFASPIPAACWPSRSMQRTTSRLAKLVQWDAVVAFQSPVARYALQLPGVPRVLDVDTAYSYQMHERNLRQRHLVARLRTWVSCQKAQQYEAGLFRRFGACTVASPIELDFVKAMMGTSECRVELSPNGVDCRYDSPNLAHAVPDTLIFNGALTYSANYDAMHYFLAEIHPLIRQQEPAVSLTITGSTSGVNLSGLQLDESTRLSDYVDDIRPLVAAAWVCVVPIHQGGGTRLKILEAMALGTPVVTTSKGAEGLNVTSNHDILIADEPGEFATQVIRLLRDSALRERLATNGRRLVEQHYDWSNIGRRFVDLVEDVASRHVREEAWS